MFQLEEKETPKTEYMIDAACSTVELIPIPLAIAIQLQIQVADTDTDTDTDSDSDPDHRSRPSVADTDIHERYLIQFLSTNSASSDPIQNSAFIAIQIQILQTQTISDTDTDVLLTNSDSATSDPDRSRPDPDSVLCWDSDPDGRSRFMVQDSELS